MKNAIFARTYRIYCLIAILVCLGGAKAQVEPNRIGVLWSSWDPSHFQNYPSYIDKMQDWGINYVSLNPTYFIDTYEEGIATSLWGTTKTPSIGLQKNVIKELIRQGFYINFRPHLDPIKYAMPLGETRDQWNTNPGGKDWRGKFDRLDPTNPTIGYMDKIILPSMRVLAESIREAGAPAQPIRFDLGAELMDSMLHFPKQWNKVLRRVRRTLNTDYRDVKEHIVIGHNFCHHLEYLLRLPRHRNYLQRINPSQTVDVESLYLDRPHVPDDHKQLIGRYISGLDEMSISQYLPLDIFNQSSYPKQTTPNQVAESLRHHESHFINEVLIAELGLTREEIPVLHIGEYGMGWRGLVAPNVWDTAAWGEKGASDLLLGEATQKAHAAIGIKGVIQYMKQEHTEFRSLLLWLGGKPYDVIGINSYSQGWYNQPAADALWTYWSEHRKVLSSQSR